MKAEGGDDLSRSAARARRASESTAAFWRIMTSEAEHLGEHISLHLFATADNTRVPRFFALYPEPLAEGADGLVQPDWGRFRCPHCGQHHREFRGLLAARVAKARSDGRPTGQRFQAAATWPGCKQ